MHRKYVIFLQSPKVDFIGAEHNFISVGMMHILPGNIIVSIVKYIKSETILLGL